MKYNAVVAAEDASKPMASYLGVATRTIHSGKGPLLRALKPAIFSARVRGRRQPESENLFPKISWPLETSLAKSGLTVGVPSSQHPVKFYPSSRLSLGSSYTARAVAVSSTDGGNIP